MSLFALFRRKPPRGERYFVLKSRGGVSFGVFKQGYVNPYVEVFGNSPQNAVRVAGKIAKMLNAGKLK
jgi:hypothetical protein